MMFPVKLRIQSFIRFAVIGALVALSAACGRSNDSADECTRETTTPLSVIEISPVNGRLVNGTTLALQATGIYQDGRKQDLTGSVTWSSSNDSIAIVSNAASAKGTVAGLAAGMVTVSAALDGVSGHTGLTVTEVGLSQVELSVESQQVAAGSSVPLSAIGIFADDSRQDLTDQVSWSSSNEAVVSISNVGGTTVATAHSAGTATISATIGGATITLELTVPAGVLLERIEVYSESNRVVVGTTLPLSAVGIYSDGTRQTLTDQVDWASSNPGLIDIISVDGTAALAAAVAAGSASISASLDGHSDSVDVTVTNAQLERLEVFSEANSLNVGASLAFSAIGVYEDDSHRDLTEQVTWSSSDETVISVGNASGYSGLATALATGNAEIRASYNDISGASQITVNDATLNAITINAASTIVAVGTDLALSARGNYSDGTTRDITALVNWRSSDTAVAAVSNSPIATGTVTPKAAGAVTVSAALNSVIGTVALEVRDTLLNTIRIEPADSSIAVGTTLAMRAIGVYVDGTEQDLSDQVTWTSADDAVVGISNSPGSQGLTEGLQAGTSGLTAAFAGISGTTQLTVTPQPITAIEITPTGHTMTVGTTTGFQATGVFGDGSRQDITSQVVWRSSDEAVVQLSNSADSSGRATALAAGTATITASFEGISASTGITSMDEPTTPVSLTVRATPDAILNNGSESTTLEVLVRAAGGDGYTVPDGTGVSFTVVSGTANLSSTSAQTTDGRANVTMTSTFSGTIEVEVTVVGYTISNRVKVFATNRLTDVFWQDAFFDGDIVNNSVQAGARFGYFILNTSNRTFDLTFFRLVNGGTVVDSIDLSTQQLAGGRGLGHTIQINNTQTDNGFVALYELIHPSGGTMLSSFNYPLPANTAP